MKGVIKITDRNRLRTGFAPLYALVILGIIIGSMYAESDTTAKICSYISFLCLFTAETHCLPS